MISKVVNKTLNLNKSLLIKIIMMPKSKVKTIVSFNINFEERHK